ncbi:hypothetical protein DVH24_012639 [Malus domestica]|uniref:Uncharacterized protein n=1 Tax=Malus domestica TaxID=3750 RepID=A0A498HTR0_MALDO|nr:hypothetical protein DVH24_012639 [Malus domestica]
MVCRGTHPLVCCGTYPRVSFSSPCKPTHFPLTYFCHPHTCLSSLSVLHPSLLSLSSLIPEQHSHHVLRRLRTPNHHHPHPNLTPDTELEPKVPELRLEPQIGEPELRLESERVPAKVFMFQSQMSACIHSRITPINLWEEGYRTTHQN